MTDKEMLDSMRVLFGNDVMYTNGLYHLLQDDHSEIYIDTRKKDLDRRCRYSTVVVLDNIIVARVLNLMNINFVVLEKDTLDCLYKTRGKIVYLDDNLVYDKLGGNVTFISHTGKILLELKDIKSIEIIDDKRYLVRSSNSFSDTILWYRPQLDIVTSIAKNKRYLIYRCRGTDNSVEVVPMQGGKYVYNFKTNTCENTFTGAVENIQLFDVLAQ